MSQISKEAYKKCDIETIDKGQYSWLSRRDLEIESGYSNWAAFLDKCHPKKEKYRYELMPTTKIRSRRRASEQFLNSKKS